MHDALEAYEQATVRLAAVEVDYDYSRGALTGPTDDPDNTEEVEMKPMKALILTILMTVPGWTSYRVFAAPKKHSVDLSWAVPVGRAPVSYTVYRCEDQCGPTSGDYVKIASVTLPKYSDTKVSAGRTYWYKVNAVHRDGSKSP